MRRSANSRRFGTVSLLHSLTAYSRRSSATVWCRPVRLGYLIPQLDEAVPRRGDEFTLRDPKGNSQKRGQLSPW